MYDEISTIERKKRNNLYTYVVLLLMLVTLQICTNQKQAIYTSVEVKKSLDLKIPCNVVAIKTGRIDSLSIILSKHNPFTDTMNFQ